MPTSTTLLLVEDENSLREAVSRLLGRAGYTVLAAANGTEALRFADERADIAVLVTDIRLPDMYGRRLAQRVAEVRDDSATPLGVVFVSGNATEVVDGTPLSPRERFLAKPFELADLLASIEDVLATRN